MVDRCGFYVKDDKIYIVPVKILWDKGFDREAKKNYARDLVQKLSDILGIRTVGDVTSASFQYRFQQLSPLFVKSLGMGEEVVEDSIKTLSMLGGTSCDFCYWYILSLNANQREVAFTLDCYTDVFFNPTKGYECTQAYWLAILKVMRVTDNMHVLEDRDKFIEWYKSIVPEVFRYE